MLSQHAGKFGGVVCICLSLVGISAAAADCGPKVEVAFQTLHTSGRPYRSESLAIDGDGQVNLTIFEFVPPDRMRLKTRKIMKNKEEEDGFEVVRVGNQVWNYEKGKGWGRLPSSLVDVFARRAERLMPSGEYECLGPVKFSGKIYAGYQAHHRQVVVGVDAPGQTKPQRQALWRTVLVEQETGLLAYEIVTPRDQLDELKSRTHYTYPNDIAIDPPVR